jgi:hypothetical protein
MPPLLSLHKFYQKVCIGHYPRNLSHIECDRRNRSAHEERVVLYKVIDRSPNIWNLIANMIGSSARLESSKNRRIVPQWSNQLKHRICLTTAEKANGHLLNGIVKWARNQIVAKKILIGRNCCLQVADRHSNMMK